MSTCSVPISQLTDTWGALGIVCVGMEPLLGAIPSMYVARKHCRMQDHVGDSQAAHRSRWYQGCQKLYGRLLCMPKLAVTAVSSPHSLDTDRYVVLVIKVIPCWLLEGYVRSRCDCDGGTFRVPFVSVKAKLVSVIRRKN